MISVVIEIGSNISAVTKTSLFWSVILIARLGFSRKGDNVMATCTRVPSGYGCASTLAICTLSLGSGVGPSSKKNISCIVGC